MHEYNIQRKQRSFDIWDEKGRIRMPTEDDIITTYMKANSNYPDIESEHYNQAMRLNIDFFISSDYPFDYIVMGDRAAIEEARKGSYLNPFEEKFITLGYGYDGRPFGESWGIESNCFKGYKYGEANGDFLHWYDNNYKQYQDYVRNGYDTPKVYHHLVNRDIREIAEGHSELVRRNGYGRITQKIFNELISNPEKTIIRKGFSEDKLTGGKNKVINLQK